MNLSIGEFGYFDKSNSIFPEPVSYMSVFTPCSSTFSVEENLIPSISFQNLDSLSKLLTAIPICSIPIIFIISNL